MKKRLSNWQNNNKGSLFVFVIEKSNFAQIQLTLIATVGNIKYINNTTGLNLISSLDIIVNMSENGSKAISQMQQKCLKQVFQKLWKSC